MSLPALELTHLPPTSTFEELRAICSAKGVVYSLSSTPGALPRALVLFGSTDAAAAARDLLHGSDWGGGAPLEVKEVPEGPVGWIAAEVPGVSAAFNAWLGGRCQCRCCRCRCCCCQWCCYCHSCYSCRCCFSSMMLCTVIF